MAVNRLSGSCMAGKVYNIVLLQFIQRPHFFLRAEDTSGSDRESSEALCLVVETATLGVSVLSLCEKGDAFILAETGKVFKRENEMKKGISFPTSVSVNNCVCHFSPLKSDHDYTLKGGDLVKIDLGVHVDGFIANVAHSFVVGASKENPITGRKADVIKAAHLCAEAALRLVKPGNQNTQAREGATRTTIFKRDPSKQYGLKMKTSRMFFSEVERRFDAALLLSGMNTALYGAFKDEAKARLGVVECAQHELLHEKEGLQDSRKCNGTANRVHRSCRITKYCFSTNAESCRVARGNMTNMTPQTLPILHL
ncbi:proliferation-associated protein 2G4-like [Gasterosteus aculeatus]